MASQISCVVIEKDQIIQTLRLVHFLKEKLSLSDIILVDDFSEDGTAEEGRRLGARVFQRKLNGDFASQRNFGLKKAKNEWVLFLDSDEVVTPLLAQEIVRRTKGVNKGGINGFYFRRYDFFLGQKLRFGEIGSLRILRLARKDAGFWQGKVHETWRIKGKAAIFKNPILHYTHTTITSLLNKINFYTTLRSQELYSEGVKVRWWEIILYPTAKFFQNYLIRLGFLDGTAGIIFALMMCLHSFMVRAKLWQLWQQQK